MNYQKLAETGMRLSGSNAQTFSAGRGVSSPVSRGTVVNNDKGGVLDDVVNSRRGMVRGANGRVMSRVADATKDIRMTPKTKVVDSYTAEQLLDMPRNARRKYLGGLTAKNRSKMLGEMNKIKDSRRVSDAIENMDGDAEKSQLINLTVLLNNLLNDDSEFSRKLLAECLENLPEKYAEYCYNVLDGAELTISQEEFDAIDEELEDIRTTFNIQDSRKKVTDSVLDDIVETPAVSNDIDALLSGIGEYLKTGNIDKLSEVRQMMVGGGAKASEEDAIEEENTEEEEIIQENTDDIFKDGAGTTEETDDADLFGDGTETEELDTESDETSEESAKETDEDLEDVGFEDEPEVIEVPEGVDESVKSLVQELLDIFGSKSEEGIEDSKLQKICVGMKKFLTDSLDGNSEGAVDYAFDGESYQLNDYPTLEASEELVRVPLTYEDYMSLSNAQIREEDIKSLMPSYSCCTSQIEPCNSRCVKVTSEDGVVSFWTPICGSVDESALTTMTCEDLQKSFVPVNAFCKFASKLNQLDLIDNNFYKESVESPEWRILADCDAYGLKAGDRIIPDCEGDVKIFDRCYKKVSNE